MFCKIPDKCFALSGTTIERFTSSRICAARFRNDNLPVIPGLSRDLGLFRDLRDDNLLVFPDVFRDLLKQLAISNQPLHPVPKIPNIAERFRDDGE
jgi:hypothetical protein